MKNLFDSDFLDCTLVFLVSQTGVILGRHRRKLVVGKWNGYGGKIENESPRECAVREVFHESGREVVIDPADLSFRALAYFYNEPKGDEQRSLLVRVRVYLCERWLGFPQATDEMDEPTVFPLSGLPWPEMAPGDRYWLPPVLEGHQVTAFISYAADQAKLSDEPIVVLDYLPSEDLID